MQEKPTQAFDVRVSSDAEGLLVVRGTEAYSLAGVGADIWARCDGEHTADDIAQAVAAAYAVDAETARADTGRFLDQLARAGLIE